MTEESKMLAGRYKLGRELGRGGMADVFIGTDTRLHRSVAIKILRADLARDENFQERFRREAQSVAGLNHPCIVAVYDTGEEITTDHAGRSIALPFIVMEYVEGETLRDLIKPGKPLSEERSARIMSGILSALEYSHRAGIVHRDIKPGNVMITPAGQIKVMDFGIARAVADATSAMTQTQAVMGTAQYLSPEQARGETVDARSDIYSAACVLYEMLTGRAPFVGDSPVSIAYQHVRETAPKPSQFNATVSPAMDMVVLKGLAKNRDDRYQSADAFARDIRAAVAGDDIVASGSQLAVPGDETQVLSPVAADAAATQVISPAQTTSILSSNPAQGTTGQQAGVATGTATVGVAGPIASTTGTITPVKEEPKTGAAILWVLVALALLSLAGLIGWWFLRPSGPADITVPTVAGLSQDAAKQQLAAVGLNVKVTQEASTDVAQGNVIDSDPPAGSKVQKGSSVTLKVSSGPADVTVPDLTGLTREQAEKKLREAGLDPMFQGNENVKDIAKDTVTRAEPGYGTTARYKEEIKFWTASGMLNVPNVVGATEADATKTLQDAGLGVSVVQSESTKTAGTVLSQNPAGDAATVAQGSTVTITVAKAPGPSVMKNYVGHSFDDAKSGLEADGFGISRAADEFSDTVAAGAVISTDPAPGNQVAPGTTVKVTVSKGKKPAEPKPEKPSPSSPAPAPSNPGEGGNEGGQ